MTASKTQTASMHSQPLAAVVAASLRQQVCTDLKHQSLPWAAAAVKRTVECSYAQASSLCCKQGVDPGAARISCRLLRSLVWARHQRPAMKRIRFRGTELLGQTVSVGCFREARCVWKACLEAATWEEELTVALGGESISNLCRLAQTDSMSPVRCGFVLLVTEPEWESSRFSDQSRVQAAELHVVDRHHACKTRRESHFAQRSAGHRILQTSHPHFGIP